MPYWRRALPKRPWVTEQAGPNLECRPQRASLAALHAVPIHVEAALLLLPILPRDRVGRPPTRMLTLAHFIT